MSPGIRSLLSWLKFLISPEMQPRRIMAPGFQRELFPLWAVLAALFAVYQLFIGGKTFTLFMPVDYEWAWQEIRLPLLSLSVSGVLFLYTTGVCLFPRVTLWLSAVVFSGYFLYGAANSARVDLLLGFGEPLVYFLDPILPAGLSKNLSWLWGTFQFPTLQLYAFQYYLTLYIFFTAILTFLYYPAAERSPKHRPSAADVLLFVVTLGIVLNYIVNFADRGERAGIIVWHDVIMGFLAAAISIEMCRRLLGWVLPALGILFCVYAVHGNAISGRLHHAGFTWNELSYFLFGSEGIFGVVAGVYASYVFLFIIFGVFLELTKVGDVFVKLSFALVGHLRGGPAKAAVVSSGLVGMICGSGAPNIVITGTFTIPMMKRAGFMPHFAAAVEAVASTGGILMPPVMGSAAFLMAAFTEIDYNYIALVAFMPAVMYYYQCYMSVHHRAGLRGIHGIPKEELPRLGEVMRKEGYLLLPVLVLVIRLVIGRSPFDAALWAIMLSIFLGFFREDTRVIGLPPLVARALGVPAWSTGVDWERVRAEERKAAMLRDHHSAEAIEAEYQRIVAGAMEVPRGAFWRENWMLAAGVAIFAVLLLAGAEPGNSLFWGVTAILVLSSPRVLDGLEKGALGSLVIGVTAGVVGVMLAGISLPGLGLKFPSIVLGYAQTVVEMTGWQWTELPMIIFLTGAAAYVMGMGMTASAAYILLSVLAVPALIKLGVPLLNAHLLTLWFTITAPLTPPFALGAFIAAGIAGADPMRTGFASVRLAWALYIVPFLMAYTPILMNKDASWPHILVVWVTTFMGFYCCAAGFEGFLRCRLKVWERANFLLAAFLLFSDVWWTFSLGTLLMIAGIVVQIIRARGQAEIGDPVPVPAESTSAPASPPA